MLDELDLLIRGAVIGISALTFTLLWWKPSSRRKSYSIGALAMTLAGHMAETQGISGAWSPQARAMASLVGNTMPIAMTWFILSVFLDRHQRQNDLVRALIALSIFVWILCLSPAAFTPVHIALNVTLELGLLYLIIVTDPCDLVARRRSFRTVFVTLILTFSVSKLLLDGFLGAEGRPVWFDTAYASVILGFVIVFAHWSLRPGRDIWAEEDPRPMNKPIAVEGADTHVLGLIQRAMEDQIWRREGLTIGAMADELQLPEHRLRSAINRDLGYRNFSAFVNGYRIEAAKAALTAPENAEKTILEIAYDVGFASLGPFNKAFRAMTGTSPRDYRRSALDDRSIPA